MEAVFDRAPAVVSAYAGDPTNAPTWYVNIELVPDERLVTQTAQGPFPMRTTYTCEPAGFSRLAAPVMATAMRRAMAKDLAALKRTLEG